jgi:hypothetical protein
VVRAVEGGSAPLGVMVRVGDGREIDALLKLQEYGAHLYDTHTHTRTHGFVSCGFSVFENELPLQVAFKDPLRHIFNF